MAVRKLRTADYDQTARDALARAITEAREGLGEEFIYRPAFAKLAGVSLRSLADAETGKPTVGEKNLKAIAAQLPGWTTETPRDILEGAPPPPVAKRAPISTSEAPEAGEPRHEWSADERRRMLDMTMTEVQETYELFLRRSEYLASVWMREVMRVKAEAEQAKATTQG